MTVWQNRFWLAGLAAFALSACESGGSLEPMGMEEAPMRVEARSKSVLMADAMMVEAPAPALIVPTRMNPTGKRGVVTAGDIDDTLNLAAFLRYQAGGCESAQAATGKP
jgi:hypothetical protein